MQAGYQARTASNVSLRAICKEHALFITKFFQSGLVEVQVQVEVQIWDETAEIMAPK